MAEDRRDLKALRDEIENLRDTLSSFIAWTAQSAGSPISQHDAELLLLKLNPKPRTK